MSIKNNPFVGIQHTVWRSGYRAAMRDLSKFAQGIIDATPDVENEGHIIVRTMAGTFVDLSKELTKDN